MAQKRVNGDCESKGVAVLLPETLPDAVPYFQNSFTVRLIGLLNYR